MADSCTWWRVAPALVEQGYRVLAPDLRGHGRSPRGGYAPGTWGEGLAESLPADVEVAIGHSLGGQALATAIEQVMPARAVFYEPAWRLDGDPATAQRFSARKHADARQITADHPDWCEDDVRLELRMRHRWDERTVEALTTAGDYTPTGPAVPSLVLAAHPSTMVPPDLVAQLRAHEFEVRDLDSDDHSAHRRDPDGFLTALAGWV
jgi:pimeloyl-ACP methyl ester carboxylesterase